MLPVIEKFMAAYRLPDVTVVTGAGGDDDRVLARTQGVRAGIVGAVGAAPRMARLHHVAAADLLGGGLLELALRPGGVPMVPRAGGCAQLAQVRGQPVVGSDERAPFRSAQSVLEELAGAGLSRWTGHRRRSAASRSRACPGAPATGPPTRSRQHWRYPGHVVRFHRRARGPVPACQPVGRDSQAPSPAERTQPGAEPEGEDLRVSCTDETHFNSC